MAFDQRRSDGNLRPLFGIARIPNNMQIRTIFAATNPEHLRRTFADAFREDRHTDTLVQTWGSENRRTLGLTCLGKVRFIGDRPFVAA